MFNREQHNKRKKIGFKAGRWEILHPGHISCLKRCAELCDELYVLVHDKDNEFLTADERVDLLVELPFVDDAFTYTDDVEDNALKELIGNIYENTPDSEPMPYFIMFHSEELISKLISKKDKNQKIPGQKLVDSVVFIPREPGISTSAILKRKK